MPVNPNQKDYVSSTIANTAGTILALADGGAITLPAGARSFAGTLETASIRARGDGTIPSTTEGRLIPVGATVYLSESEIGAVQFIRTGSASGVIKGEFYDVPVQVLLGKDG
jgi:hypothetical protein